MDLRWSERFSRLEAMLLAKSINQPEPSFQPVKITPVKPPPAGAVDNTEPFFAPTRATDRTHLNRPLVHLFLLTDLLPPTSLQLTQLLNHLPPHLGSKPPTAIQIWIWTLTLLLIPNLCHVFWAILRKVNSLTLNRTCPLLMLIRH